MRERGLSLDWLYCNVVVFLLKSPHLNSPNISSPNPVQIWSHTIGLVCWFKLSDAVLRRRMNEREKILNFDPVLVRSPCFELGRTERGEE